MKAAVLRKHGDLDVVEAVAAARLEPVVDSVHPLGSVRDAMGRMAAGQQFGKILLSTA